MLPGFDTTDAGGWKQTCPNCGEMADARLRPDTRHYAELRCPHCRHFRWLPTPKKENRTMSTGTQTQTTGTSDPWEIEVTKDKGGEYKLCPSGNFPASIVGLFDVGHHPAERDDGTAYERRMLVLVFELAKKDESGKPYLLAESYTWSMRDNSKFYKLASGLTGKKFNEGERFDPRSILGTTCMVQVTNSTVTKNGKEKTYHNVGGVAQFPEGLPAPTPTIKLLAWSVMGGEPLPDTSWVPYVYGNSVKDLVQMSSEYKSGKVVSVEAPAKPADEEDDDRIPF